MNTKSSGARSGQLVVLAGHFFNFYTQSRLYLGFMLASNTMLLPRFDYSFPFYFHGGRKAGMEAQKLHNA